MKFCRGCVNELWSKTLQLLQAALCKGLLLRRILICGLEWWIRHVCFLFKLVVEIFQDSWTSLCVLLSRVVILFQVVELDKTFVWALFILWGVEVHIEVNLLCLTSSMVTLTLRILIKHVCLVDAQPAPTTVEWRLLLDQRLRLFWLITLLLLYEHVLHRVDMADSTSSSFLCCATWVCLDAWKSHR